MTDHFVNIHTHRPTGRGIELRTEGVHPWDADKLFAGASDDRSPITLPPLSEGIQAVGEIGLDRARGAQYEHQLAVFRTQLAQARACGLPVVIHCVRAFEQVMGCLSACEPRAVIFHGFIGSPEQAQQALDKGYYLSFGERTFASPRTLEALRRTPLTQLFVETDESPEPIETIYTRIAEAKSVSLETLRCATLNNYERLFTHG